MSFSDFTLEELINIWNSPYPGYDGRFSGPWDYFDNVASSFAFRGEEGAEFLLSQLPPEHSDRGASVLVGLSDANIPRDKKRDIFRANLGHLNDYVAGDAIHGLIQIEDTDSRVEIEGLLTDDRPYVRRRAIHFLSALFPAESIHVLESGPADKDSTVRANTIERISWSPDQTLPAQFEDRIWPLLEDDDENIRFEACYFMYEQCPRDMFGRPDTRSPEATPERMRIFKLFLAREDHDAIVAAAWDESPLLRREAARWIRKNFGGCADEYRAGTNQHLRNDPDPRVRAAFDGE